MPSTHAPHAALQRYAAKRNFDVTPEPPAVEARTGKTLRYVIQKHWASHLHYDFRLEHAGVLLSWAVPKGPSFDPKDKRMAVHVEDHPVSYGSFEGSIPSGHYGAGTVIVWDQGTWEPVGDVGKGLAQGKLVFKLHGEKLAGLWELVRISKPGDKRDNWLLFKKHDEWARSHDDYDVTQALPDSVIQQPLGLLDQSPAQAAEPALPSDPMVGAKRAALPKTLAPQLATLAKGLPTSGNWLYEFKFDGYRILARIERGKVRLFTRAGNDWTDKMPALAREIEAWGITTAWLDGEVVALGKDGLPDFNVLQNAFDASRTSPLIWYAFDAPFLDGKDLRTLPLRQRRAALKARFEGHAFEHIRFSEALDAPAQDLWRNACDSGLEGLMAKRADAGYIHGRSDDWLKLKCAQRQEFIVIGYTERTEHGTGRHQRGDFGSLLLAYHDEQGRLSYAGNVGTGWDENTRRDLYQRMHAIEVAQRPPGIETPKRGRWTTRAEGIEHWLKPQLVVEVRFGEWTPDGRIRHASFQGLRVDKPAKQITRERAMPVSTQAVRGTSSTKPAAQGDAHVGTVKITHGSRIVDPSTGLTKLDVARYYDSIAERMLPHLKDRPVSLVRAPDGIEGEKFFQKHADRRLIPDVRELDPALWPGHAALLEVHSPEALIQAAQMNVLEFHTWNATTRHMDKPDRLIFDLDPGEGVTWAQVREAAVLLKAVLDELHLKSWLKTSGGKGLHVVVPIAPRHDWERVKAFSQTVVQHLARTIPSRFAAKSGPKNRVGRIFADYLRNGEGQTTAAAFSVRARPGLGVSMPIAWEQLSELKGSAQWTMATARDYLSFAQTDPWADYWSCKQSLAQAMKQMARL
jgi:bifunctional non-homologous end joining protein LigD